MSSVKSAFEFLVLKRKEKRSNDNRSVVKRVGFLSLYRFSTTVERFFLSLGIVFAIIAACGLPLITEIYGEYINILMNRQFSTEQSSELQILHWFGAHEILINATESERMAALEGDAVALVEGVSLFCAASLILLGMSVSIFSFIAALQVNRIRMKLFEALLSQSAAWYDLNGRNSFTSEVSEHLSRVQQGIGENVSVFIYQMSVTIIVLGLSLYLGWVLTIVLMGCLFPMITAIIVTNKIQNRITARQTRDAEAASQLAEESLSAIRTVVAFSGEGKEIERYSQKLSFIQNLGIAKAVASGFRHGFANIAVYFTYAVAFSFGFRLILWDEEYTTGVIVTVFFATLTAATCLSYASPYCESFTAACRSAGTIFEIIDTKSTINPLSSEGLIDDNCKGGIEFKNVHFHYPSRPEMEVLRGVTFKINAGETVALVGVSGSGKSTILQLIQRLFDPVVGDVFLDNVNIKYLNVSWFRRQIAVVPQKSILFSGTINDNITYGMLQAKYSEVIEAARKAQAHDFISDLPERYETYIQCPGANLSEGEKQRIAIARALIRQSKILLLDEVTAELDRETEALVYRSLEDAYYDRTVIIVTHNISTLRHVDRIIVLKDGVIVEEGTHKSLISSGGIYSNWTKIAAENIKRPLKGSLRDRYHLDLSLIGFEDDIKILPGARGSYFSEYTLRKDSQRRSKDEYFLRVTICQFLTWNKNHCSFLLFGMLAGFLSGLVLPSACVLFAIIIGCLVDIQPPTGSIVDIYSIIIVCLGFLAGILGFIHVCFLGIASLRLSTYLRLRTFETMMRQEISWFDLERNNVSALCSHLNEDCSVTVCIIGNRSGIIIQGFISLLCGFIISFYFSWKLSCVTALVVPFIFVAIFLDSFSFGKQKNMESKVAENSNKIIVEAVNNIQLVNSLGIESYFLSKYGTLFRVHRDWRRFGIAILRGFAYSTGQIAVFFGYAFSLWFGSYLIIEEGLHYKYIIMIAELIIYGGWVLGQSLSLAPNIVEALNAAGRLQYLFLRRARIRDGPSAVCPFSNAGEAIEFSNVYLAYPTRPDVIVLRNINIRVRDGESVAIIGPSGSGKSSVIHLLLRFCDPSTGSITIGNDKLTSLSLSNVRYSMGLVSQEPVLFARTIFENIAYGDNRKKISLDEVVAAAKAANIHSFIMSLPLGYNTKIGSISHLSAGQKQKIAIARALIRNPKVLLLDEATSALDPESESAIQETLSSAMNGRTTITIARRLETIVRADSTYVLVKGRIVEAGNHRDMVTNKGHYYKMREDY